MATKKKQSQSLILIQRLAVAVNVISLNLTKITAKAIAYVIRRLCLVSVMKLVVVAHQLDKKAGAVNGSLNLTHKSL